MGIFDIFKKKKNDDNNIKKEKTVDFLEFSLSINYCRRENDVYECRISGEEIILQNLSVTCRWEGMECIEERHVIAEINGGMELIKTVQQLLTDCKVHTWDGFAGVNPPGVLDGSSMQFKGKLVDGNTINAYGSNNFPEGYTGFRNRLHELINKKMLKSEKFTLHDCELTVPKEWIDNVSLTYYEDGVCFNLITGTEDEVFLRFEYSNYGYGESDNNFRLGRIIKAEKTSYLSFCVMNKKIENATNIQKLILENTGREGTLKNIQNSIIALNDSQFIKEEGKELYYCDARRIFDKAKSFWLGLYFGGDYTSGCRFAEVDGRQYKTVCAHYEYPKYRNYEDIKKAMYNLFDVEFANNLIEEKAKQKNLIIYDNELYADCAKSINSYIYGGSSIEKIKQSDINHVTITIEVNKSTENDEKYHYSTCESIEFELVRNMNGKFVFKTFPFWFK